MVFGAAVATAVLTGALMVGDSVRGSLRMLTLERLGGIDHAMVADRFFREELAAAMTEDEAFDGMFNTSAPAILMRATAINPDNGLRASKVNVIGIDRRFIASFTNDNEDLIDQWDSYLLKDKGQLFESVVINEAVQKELNIGNGNQILISFERHSDIHRESLFGSAETSDVVRSLRLTLKHVLQDEGLGRFGLRPHQDLPLNIFIALPVLQRSLEEDERVNTILVSEKSFDPENDSRAQIQKILARSTDLEDYGFKLKTDEHHFSLSSAEFLLKAESSRIARAVAREMEMATLPILTYLANKMTVDGNTMPYSTVSAFDPREPFDLLRLADGSPAPDLQPGEMLLNAWAASDLDAAVGDSVEMSYFKVGNNTGLLVGRSNFTIRGILPVQGLAADRTLAPDFPGIQGAENMADWDPTFPIDLSLIRPQDEAYWDEYRATPKAFVSAETGQKLWSSRFGNLTSIRFKPASGADLNMSMKAFKTEFLRRYSPTQAGMIFQPVKAIGLNAANGATDFGMLFIGFSLFLIASAALLVGLLFRLGVEQRAAEIGIRLSIGYPTGAIRRIFFKEAFAIAGTGCFLGLLGAISYSSIIIHGLRTWWVEAVGTSFLSLHINPFSLFVGFASAMLIVLFSVWRTIRRFGKIPALSLLSGKTVFESKSSGRIAKYVAVLSFFAAIVIIVISVYMEIQSSAALFMISGSLLLISGLEFLSVRLRKLRNSRLQTGKSLKPRQMSVRNTAVFPGRSLLCVALVACACFVIVAVGANKRDVTRNVADRSSGSGGYLLMGESDIPIYQDLNSEDDRYELGFNDAASSVLSKTQVTPFRLLPGEDASCLNLYKPEKPRILGVTSSQIERGGFHFQASIEGSDNPWTLLESESEPNVIPAIGDFNSVMWILHLGLGKDLVMMDEYGREIKLRLVGLLEKSIFQSEILISESNFLEHFPNRGGYSFFLVDVAEQSGPQVAGALENNLKDFGFDVRGTADQLAAFQAVENTYLAVFQSLGGLGLILGTLGLGIVLFRNAIERKGELASLRAFGFQRSVLAFMLISENGFLIILGILVGTVSALISVLPQVTGGATQVPWLSLFFILTCVLAVGLLAGTIAVFAILRAPLLPALKGD